MNFKQARATLHSIGISLSHGVDSEEFRVNLRGATEATAYYTTHLDDAIATGKAMAAQKSDALS